MGLVVTFVLALLLCTPVHAQQRFMTVASTTSTEQSGLFKYLLPLFENKTGIQVRVVALGTGQSLDMGKRGDADVVFVHAKPLEEKFVAEGFGVQRFEVMYNDFAQSSVNRSSSGESNLDAALWPWHCPNGF